ncbi:MAG: Nickel-dependent hydrogenase [Parcubacteria group bacterium GW2011_GWA2_45_30]|nr:MAG: Nickel-dependent hydrogenase [Parcubacteria group bacterium GW2011_GWA2_45_30]
MHNTDFDLKLDRLTKVEGSASLDIRVKNGQVEYAHFQITEYKRFFTQAMQRKPIIALPQLLSRICGTCSNAHIMASIEACEHALDIKPSEQTKILRDLTMYGLNIRDHALHLYLFALPDVRGKDAFLDFDENDPVEHQMLHDAFEIKAAGNFFSELIAGRSVHAPYPVIGGFMHFPDQKGITEAIKKFEAVRPAVLRTIEIYKNQPFHFDRKTNFMALVPYDHYGFIEGCINTGLGECITEEGYRDHLERVVLPYSQASGYKYRGGAYMVGALARMNLAKNLLHARTKDASGGALDIFPSTDIYMSNLAQAIEILHCLDHSLEILKTRKFNPEPIIKKPFREAVGIGVVEAPRGTLYHKVVVGADGMVKEGEIIVPTGQNQINIENDVAALVEKMLPDTSQEKMQFEIEKLIRAYDPCMSCAAHFLKVKWLEP